MPRVPILYGSGFLSERSDARISVVALFSCRRICTAAPARAQAGDIMSDNYSIMVPKRDPSRRIAGALACAEVQVAARHSETAWFFRSRRSVPPPNAAGSAAVCLSCPQTGRVTCQNLPTVFGSGRWRCGDLPGPRRRAAPIRPGVYGQAAGNRRQLHAAAASINDALQLLDEVVCQLAAFLQVKVSL